MVTIDQLKFDEKGLIPAVVVDFETKKALTLAYMNEESLKISMEKGLTCFWSRSRQELWLKGDTSGNYQHIYSITADCDRDALVVTVMKDGPACHLGTDSCFNDLVYLNPENAGFTMEGLMELIEGRMEGTGPQRQEPLPPKRAAEHSLRPVPPEKMAHRRGRCPQKGKQVDVPPFAEGMVGIVAEKLHIRGKRTQAGALEAFHHAAGKLVALLRRLVGEPGRGGRKRQKKQKKDARQTVFRSLHPVSSPLFF